MKGLEKCLNWNQKSRLFFRCFFVFIFAISLFFILDTKSESVPAIINYQGKILQSGVAVDGNLGMSFTIYDANSGGNAVYTAFGILPTISTSSIAISEGLFSINLGTGITNVLDASIFASHENLFLEIVAGGETLSPRKRLTAVPYAFNAKYLEGFSPSIAPVAGSSYIPVADGDGGFTFINITTTDIIATNINTQNLTITATTTARNILPNTNALYSLGSSLFRWLKGWFVDLETTNLLATNVTTTDLVVTDTANIENAIITSSTLTNSNIENLIATNVTTTNFHTASMTVDGRICDSLGNCFFPADVTSTDSSITQITTTTILYDGSFGGYVGGNNICDAYLSGSHMCTAEEILFLIRKIGPIPLFDDLSYAWISNGPPGYLAPSNDCSGWSSNSYTNYGPVWDWSFSRSTGGRGMLTPCDGVKPLACCK